MFNNTKKYVSGNTKTKSPQKALMAQNENGDFVYELSLEKNEVYSSLATQKNKIINPDIISNLDIVANNLTIKDSLELHIVTPTNNPASATNIENALDEHYNREIMRSKWEQRRQTLQGLLMLLVGIILFSTYAILTTYVYSVWWEIIDIASWVFVWEAIDLIIIGRSIKRLEQVRFNKIVNAKITIETVEKKTKNK